MSSQSIMDMPPPAVRAAALTKEEIASRNAGIEARIAELEIPAEMPWIETLHICDTSAEPTETSIPDINDDINRELVFLSQALRDACSARTRLNKLAKELDMPALGPRPSDYFAEMFKSDALMCRIRQRLVDEAVALRAADQARAQRESKKLGKAIQLERQREREQAKKSALDRIQAIRKSRKSTPLDKDGMGHADNDDAEFDIALDQSNPRSASNPKKNFKRMHRDKKYGFGGPKRGMKRNTAESTNDIGSFNPKKMKKGTFGPKGVSKKTNQKNSRQNNRKRSSQK